MMLVPPLPRQEGFEKLEGYHVWLQLCRDLVSTLVVVMLYSCRSGLRKEPVAPKPGHGASCGCQSVVLFVGGST